LTLAVGDPGGAHPGQQVEVGLVFGQHHRVVRQRGELLPQRRQHLVVVGVALGDQPGSPPGRNLTYPPVQGPQAHGRTAQPLPEPTDCPCRGFGQQPQDPLAKPWATQAGPARAGSVGQAGDPVGVVAADPAAHGGWVGAQQVGDGAGAVAALREQDHDQAGGDAVGAVQQPGHVAGAAGAGRAGGIGVHAGGTHTGGGLVGRLVCESFERPTRLLRVVARLPLRRYEENRWSPAWPAERWSGLRNGKQLPRTLDPLQRMGPVVLHCDV
jgi:hypothetical protein